MVSVPATTANLGPGFDCLGLALDLCNRTTFSLAETGQSIEITGEGSEVLPADSSNLVLRAAQRLFDEAGQQPSGLHVLQENSIPVGSGLGSSSAAVLGGMLAANAIIGNPLNEREVLKLAAGLEGHPDNVTPALLGGLTVTVIDDDDLVVERVSIPDLQVVVVLPEFNLSTQAARRALPHTVPLADAIFNIGRVPLLVRALEQGNYDRLAVAMKDRLHQPYRLALIPGMAEAFIAGKQAGAAAVALSGAGPSAIAFAADHHDEIARAMAGAFAAEGVDSRAWILAVHRHGSQIHVDPAS